VRVKHYQTVVQVLAPITTCSLLLRRLSSGCCPFFGSRPSSTSGCCSFLLRRPLATHQRLLPFLWQPPLLYQRSLLFPSATPLSPYIIGHCLLFCSCPPCPAPSASVLSFCAALSPHPIGRCSFRLCRPTLAPSQWRCSLVQSRSSRPAASAAALSFGIAHLAPSHRPLLIGLDPSSKHCSQVCNGVGYIIGE
jgi:hypothetical protein